MRLMRFTRALAAGGLILSAGALQAQDPSLERLNASPRHHEWVEVPAGERSVRTFVAYPERKTGAPAILVIHENRGLTDWVRSFADQIAEAGYVAVAPDLLSGFSETVAHTGEFPDADAARDAIYKLPDDQVMADLKAVRDYAAAVPAASGRVAVAGFCWGGAKSFLFATRERNLAAVLTFYGSPPDKPEDLKRIYAPVYGFYGEEDNRINAQLPAVQKHMKRFKKVFEPVIYEGAGHAFMRLGEDPAASPANKAARDKAWERIKAVLGKI